MSMYSDSLRAFLKPVLPYLDDESVSEIMINGPEDVWIERKGKLSKTDAKFSEEGLLGAARNMAQFVGRILNDERPRLDARLPDGSRIHVVLPPIARRGATISIRKFFKDKLTIDALLKFGSMSKEMARVIEAGIATKLNMVVAGGTGSGKTTLLNIVSSLIPDEERILTIEDSAELQLNQTHLVTFESRPPDKFGKGGVDMGDLLHSALRLRPDRIIVGEVRGGEAFHLMQAMNTGHGGSLATTHANTPTDTLRRLESLCLMSTVELPMVAVRAQVASAINAVICCERLHDGSRKTTAISEVLPLSEKGEYRTQDLFVFTPVTKDEDGHILGYHAPTGIIPNFVAKARAYGFGDLDEKFFDPATYGLPPPPQFAVGSAYEVRWAGSLKHREKGIPDPEEFKSQWADFEKKLRDDAKAQRGGKPQVAVPASLPASLDKSKPAAGSPSSRPGPSSPSGATPARPTMRPSTSEKPAAPRASTAEAPSGYPAAAASEDATPPPTRNPLLRGREPAAAPPPTPGEDQERTASGFDERLPASMMDDGPKVQIADELMAEAEAAMVEAMPTSPPRRPLAPPRPGQRPSSPGAPGMAPSRPRPGGPGMASSRPPVPSEDDEQADEPAPANGERTMIKPVDKIRR